MSNNTQKETKEMVNNVNMSEPQVEQKLNLVSSDGETFEMSNLLQETLMINLRDKADMDKLFEFAKTFDDGTQPTTSTSEEEKSREVNGILKLYNKFKDYWNKGPDSPVPSIRLSDEKPKFDILAAREFSRARVKKRQESYVHSEAEPPSIESVIASLSDEDRKIAVEAYESYEQIKASHLLHEETSMQTMIRNFFQSRK